jgi:hypothetical protein
MDDQQSAGAELVADADNAPEIDASADANEGQEADQYLDDDGNPAAPPEDDTEDIDYEGRQYKLPKELKDALLRQSDYTKKTQEVAAQRQALEAERQQHYQTLQLRQQAIGAQAEAIAISQQIQQFDAVNWTALSQEDPARAQQLWIQREQLKERLGQAHARVNQAEQQALHMQRQTAAKQVQEGAEVLAREIPGWSKDTDDKLLDYAKKTGFLAWNGHNTLHAPDVLILHKAMQYDQLMAKTASAKQKPAQAAAPVAKPVSKVKGGGSSAPTGYHPDMTDAQFNAWRRRQAASKRR